jgi:ADP-ribosylglycohydrolase
VQHNTYTKKFKQKEFLKKAVRKLEAKELKYKTNLEILGKGTEAILDTLPLDLISFRTNVADPLASM